MREPKQIFVRTRPGQWKSRPTDSSPLNPQRLPRGTVGRTRRSGGSWRRRRRARNRRRGRGCGRLLACRRLYRGLSPTEMATTPPNSFSNHLESWVFKQAAASVVFVMLTPKNPTRVRDTVNNVFPIPGNEPAEVKELKQQQRLADSKIARCSTGFILEGAPEGHVFVMTCVHTLDHVFNDKKPITAAGINGLFKVSILCDHAECNYHMDPTKPRRYIPAVVSQVDCSKDLMLLQVQMSEVQKKCKEIHRPLKLARKFPGTLE